MTEKKEEEENGAEGPPPEAEAGENAENDAGEPGEAQAGEAHREEDPDASGEPEDVFVVPDEPSAEEPADLESEVAELKDKLLRALAEMENVRRRASRDSADASRFAIGAGTPREAVAGGYGCICVLIALAGAVLVAQMVLIVSEDGETAFVALCFAVE